MQCTVSSVPDLLTRRLLAFRKDVWPEHSKSGVREESINGDHDDRYRPRDDLDQSHVDDMRRGQYQQSAAEDEAEYRTETTHIELDSWANDTPGLEDPSRQLQTADFRLARHRTPPL